jgi:hypothetical protein
MAARLNPKNDQRARDAIQTTQLCKRLNLFALGEDDPCYPGKKLEMSDGQIRAAVALLRKTIPDLAVTQHTGEGGGPVRMTVYTGVVRYDDAQPDTDTATDTVGR